MKLAKKMETIMEKIKLNIDGYIIEVTHGDKVLFPQLQLTKMDIINYYLNIADHLLPLVKDRPITINCFPNGINEDGYYRQHLFPNLPEWFDTVYLPKKDGAIMGHILCSNKASLVYLLNHNTITIHRWLSKYNDPTHPDLMIIDIDPSENQFGTACRGALILKEEVLKLSFQPSVMLTGSKGLHIIIPILEQKLTFEKTHEILYKITSKLADKYPHEYTTNVRKNKRNNAVYLDTSRNAYGQTAVAPYSLRANEKASIAMPISWNELEDDSLTSKKYTLQNLLQI
jgi:bifunctional non-homologous end joining protein LigD